ncbi:ATP-dependent RNA helicase DHX8-like [Zophobas morio]|uniref:ATP-dependent RNA helicase DHX8-like n=1 Tax=Zophobas morio TaxID=2755281 RepID=UPI003083BBDB
MNSTLSELENLQLISKICTELENHLGYSDKVAAEFIISLAESCNTHSEFHERLKENGAEFSDTFSASVWRLFKALRPTEPIISEVEKKEDDIERRKILYPGLAIADAQPIPLEIQKENERAAASAMDQLSALSTQSFAEEPKKRKEDRRRNRSNSRRGRDYERNKKKSRSRSRGRRSSRRDKSRERSRRRNYRKDSFGRSISLDREPVVGKIYNGKVFIS